MTKGQGLFENMAKGDRLTCLGRRVAVQPARDKPTYVPEKTKIDESGAWKNFSKISVRPVGGCTLHEAGSSRRGRHG